VGHGLHLKLDVIAVGGLVLNGDGILDGVTGHHALEVGEQVRGGVQAAGIEVKAGLPTQEGDGSIRRGSGDSQRGHQGNGQEEGNDFFHCSALLISRPGILRRFRDS